MAIDTAPIENRFHVYMDWFGEANDEELHSRKAGRSWEDWRDE